MTMTPEQIMALRWVLIEACDLHAHRDLSPEDTHKERADLESLLSLLRSNGEDTSDIETWLPDAAAA